MKMIYPFFLLIGINAGAILISFSTFSWKDQLLIISVILGLTPLVKEVFVSLKGKSIDLGFPIIITIIILLFLGQARVAAIFVALILLGQLFKSYITFRVKQAIADMTKSLPNTAFLMHGDEPKEVKIAEIKVGDILIVKAGGRVAVDGVLLETESTFDESVISGESKPMVKKKGENIVAGAINLGDDIKLRASDTSQNSTIAQIQKLVRDSQSRISSLSKFSDKYAKLTSIVALVLVIFIYLLHQNLLQALAVWVALVPVVFAIIVPVATTIGIALLAKKGVLVKNAQALENLTKIDTVIFDKTGTLTKGKPEIEKITSVLSYSQEELFQLVGSIEKYSEHHLADSIVARCQKEKANLFPATDVHIVKGRGISGLVNQKTVLVGNEKFLAENKITVPVSDQSDNTAIFVAVDGKYAGTFVFTDQLREEAKQVIQQLKNVGLRIVILTGDNKDVGRKIASELGIEEVYSELKPEDKIAIIDTFQKEGRKVVMIGDGINDAPALAKAHVGIAMGLKGVDITLESAQVVLVYDDLERIPEIINSSKRIFGVIKTNLFLASSIHGLTALLVITNFIGILGSAVFHEVSSALVLANTMRLFMIVSPDSKSKNRSHKNR
ncbi:MAG: cation-translocating P-type ATPase [bacterium]|nr:cation-translocating P-type ATPase [bacterium]